MKTGPWSIAVAMGAGFILAACTKSPPVPTDNYYRLTEAVATQAAGRPLTDGVILVRAIQGDGVHSERALLYTEDEQGVTLKRYNYHLWIDTPPRLIQTQLAQYLRMAGAASMVVTEIDDDPALIVSGRVLRFEREQGKDRVVAHVAVELRLDNNRGKPLLLKDYKVDTVVADEAIEATVGALDAGLQQIYGEFLADALVAGGASGTGP